MSAYKPGYVPDDPKDLSQFLRDELARLQKTLSDAQGAVTLEVLHAEPTRIWAGMYVNADGTDWNPGSGEGLYRRDQTNASWVFVG